MEFNLQILDLTKEVVKIKAPIIDMLGKFFKNSNSSILSECSYLKQQIYFPLVIQLTQKLKTSFKYIEGHPLLSKIVKRNSLI